MHAIYKFTHDMKTLVQTLGTPTVKGADGTHFNRPTYLAWLPDSTLFVADGYNGTRVAKFDKDGKFLMDWGQKGTPTEREAPRLLQQRARHGRRSRRRGVCSSTIAAITAFRCSMTTANTCMNSAWAKTRRTSI